MNSDNEYVWYVSYGSNLGSLRFFCYIEGGQYKLGGSPARGCSDKTLPRENKAITIPYSIYFAKHATKWNDGGVAFLYMEKENDPKNWTLARMWKIMREQFDQVVQQEGPTWYNSTIDLGKDGGIPILTITNSEKQPLNPPSMNYLRTIAIGLIETYKLNAKEIFNYLNEKDGIRGCFSENELQSIINMDIGVVN